MLEFKVEIPSDKLSLLADSVPRATQSGLKRVAGHVHQVAVRKTGEIYRRPIPSRAQVAAHRRKRRGGKRARRPRAGGSTPAWKRSGDLLKAVQAEPVFASNSVTIKADVPHAAPRHELGVTRHPKAPSLGIVRKNPFFAETVKITEPQIVALFEDGFNEEFRP